MEMDLLEKRRNLLKKGKVISDVVKHSTLAHKIIYITWEEEMEFKMNDLQMRKHFMKIRASEPLHWECTIW